MYYGFKGVFWFADVEFRGIINKKMEAFNEQNNSYPGNERGG